MGVRVGVGRELLAVALGAPRRAQLAAEEVGAELAAGAVGVPADGDHGLGSVDSLHSRVAQVGVQGAGLGVGEEPGRHDVER